MENLGIDTKLLVAQLINFGLFFFVFKKFIAEPFLKFVNLEKTKDQERQNNLEEIKKKEEELSLQLKKVKDQARAELTKALEEAKVQAQKVKKDLIAQAEKEAGEVMEKTKKQIAEERQEMHNEAKEQVADLSMFIVQKSLKEFFTEDMQKSITQHILKNLSKGIERYEN